MKKFHQLIALTLILTCGTSSIYAQDPYYQEDEGCCSAYMQSANTAHWSVYIPIAILVGAAIWFGIADRHHDNDYYSSDSQDALGSIDSAKRQSVSRFKSNSNFRRLTSNQSNGSYGHQ